ncbi:MAG: hypothetical protein ABIA63_13155 [bacterium]
MIILYKAIILFSLLLNLAAAQDQEEAVVLEPKVARYSYDAIPKDPLASALFSGTFPGMGQLYNKEYVRGIITGLGFWSSSIIVNYLVFQRLEQINMDTFYIEDTEGAYHRVTTPKDMDQWHGLPRSEQVLLGTCVFATTGFYLWGIIDSYRGAKRYNRKLFSEKYNKVDFRFASSFSKKSVNIDARYKF